MVKTQKRLPISVCVVAGAEAARIRRMLESVAGWTEEIVVVLNDDVDDGTDKIAEEFGAKAFREPWKGFSGQKNSAAEKAGSEWILGLDADEVVSPELKLEIQRLFAEPERLLPHAAFSFPRCTFYCGRWIRHGDWYPDRKTLLWRRGRASWGGPEPHAALVVNGAVGKLRGDLFHYSMENLNHHVRKTIGYSDIFASRQAGRKVGALELWFRPWWRFVRGYFLRRGFLDGWQGYAVARLAGQEVFLRYAKIREAKMAAEAGKNIRRATGMIRCENILLVRLKAIGDVLLTLPAVAAVRQNFPDAKITFLTSQENISLLRGFREVDEVIALDRAAFRSGNPLRVAPEFLGLLRQLRAGKFDLAIDFQGNGETGWIARFTGARRRWGSVYNPGQGWAYTQSVERPKNIHPADGNLELLRQCGLVIGAPQNNFVLPADALTAAREFFTAHRLDPDGRTLFLQPAHQFAAKKLAAGKFS